MGAPVCRGTVKESAPADPPNRFRWADETYVRVAGRLALPVPGG
jgi:hypothetical protein